MSELSIPDFCLVVLIGATGSGKSSFARRHFLETEVVSSDRCRALVSDDENDQTATRAAFELVQDIASKRLAGRRLTVIDATNVKAEDRKPYIALARKHHALPVALVINPGEAVCRARNQERPDRQFGPHVLRNQTRALKRGLRFLKKEGFRQIHEFRTVAELDGVALSRKPLWTDRRGETGPFDIIGDIHGCADELVALLTALGYRVELSGEGAERRAAVTPPAGRKAVFVGDLVDRGPKTPDVLRLVMAMVAAGDALCVLGNHENKLLRWLNGRKVSVAHGLAETIAQLEREPEAFRQEVRRFLGGLVSHYWLDEGRLCVAHAGLREEMFGRASAAVRDFAMFGETTGETDEFGLPVRYDWAQDHRSPTKIVYGHTPVRDAEWLNGTICIDTGCVFGGALTALRWPEEELVSVPAAKTYFEPIKPLAPAGAARTAQAEHDDMLDLEDFRGKRLVETRLYRTVTIAEANGAAALEVMSRFAMDPKWLVYLPPTMSPSATSAREGLLEHPDEALAYFRAQGVSQVVCEEKHMGSRAVLVVCRSAEAARRRFGVTGEEAGAVYTRTGRLFFSDRHMRDGLLDRVRRALDGADFWARFETDWVVLDAEIMPWSQKAQALLRTQYGPVAVASRLSTQASLAAFRAAAARGVAVGGTLAMLEERARKAAAFADAYRAYCWEVASVEDLRLAPFHILASEGAVHMDRPHSWHMETVTGLCAGDDPILIETGWRVVDLADAAACDAAADWWEAHTAQGGEGMVVKPLDFISQGDKGFVQPALKCRGKEYLRLVYGPEYDAPENLTRLRQRGLGRKRSLALREFALGHEGLHRFVADEPLRRVHECAFGVLALESEPVDPRL